MKNQFVSYEIALKLKELGFNEYTLGYFGKDNNFRIAEDLCNYGGICSAYPLIHRNNFILAPLWQQVIDWLFLKGVAVQFWFNSNTMCWCTEDVFNHNTGKLSVCEYLEKPSLYEIREQAILKAIELITPQQ